MNKYKAYYVQFESLNEKIEIQKQKLYLIENEKTKLENKMNDIYNSISEEEQFMLYGYNINDYNIITSNVLGDDILIYMDVEKIYEKNNIYYYFNKGLFHLNIINDFFKKYGFITKLTFSRHISQLSISEYIGDNKKFHLNTETKIWLYTFN